MIGSRMLSLRMREGGVKQIAPPTLQTNRRIRRRPNATSLRTAAPSIGTRLPARKLVTFLLESTSKTALQLSLEARTMPCTERTLRSKSHPHTRSRFRTDMSSLQRKIGGPALVQHLSRDDQLIDEALL